MNLKTTIFPFTSRHKSDRVRINLPPPAQKLKGLSGTKKHACEMEKHFEYCPERTATWSEANMCGEKTTCRENMDPEKLGCHPDNIAYWTKDGNGFLRCLSGTNMEHRNRWVIFRRWTLETLYSIYYNKNIVWFTDEAMGEPSPE